MTDNEIIKALECFALDKDFDETQCIGCAFEHEFCTVNMGVDIAKPALDLINRQMTEIERLDKELEDKQFRCDSCDRIALTSSEHRFCVKQAKAEAVKEFVKRLTFEIVNKPSEFKAVQATADFLSGLSHRQIEILDIIEEMVGDKNG